MMLFIGGCLVGGAIKGWLSKPNPRRPIKEHTPVHVR